MMASRIVGLLIVAAVLGVSVHQSEADPVRVYGNDDRIQAAATQRLVAELVPGKDLVPDVDEATYLKYLNLVSCFNGTIPLLVEECSKKSAREEYELLYRFCHENEDQLFDAYMGVFTYLTGSAIVLPVHFLKDFQQFVVKEHLDASQVEKNLALYPGTWQFEDRIFNHKDYCERMIELFDGEFALWGYTSNEVAEFFNERTTMPVGEAHKLCRKRVQM